MLGFRLGERTAEVQEPGAAFVGVACEQVGVLVEHLSSF